MRQRLAALLGTLLGYMLQGSVPALLRLPRRPCALFYYTLLCAVQAAAPDSLARYVAVIYAAALNGTAMCLALLYAALPIAGDDASDQPATMI